jgi:hypothetical protein
VGRRTTLVLCALALTLTACGSGKDAQVVKEHTAINGVNVNLADGQIQVRNVFATPTDTAQLQVPAGGSIVLHFQVFNNGSQPELMVANPPATLSGPGVVGGAVQIAPNNSVWVGGPSSSITGTIANVPSQVFVGAYVPLTLSFNNAGHVDMTVPVEDGADQQS